MARAAPFAALLALLAAAGVQVFGARVSARGGGAAALAAPGDGGDEVAPAEGTEEDRARNRTRPYVNLTALAHNLTQAHWEAMEAAEAASDAGVRSAWKWGVRQSVWDALERENASAFPRPVHFRIPNFEGVEAATEQAVQLPEFQRAKTVLMNLDGPSRLLRRAALEAGKRIVLQTLTIRMESDLRVLDPAKIDPTEYLNASRANGGKAYSEPVNVSDGTLLIDLVVVGSTAVSAKTGARLGNGEGMDDVSYALLRQAGAIGESVPVVTLAHGLQVVDDLPSDRMASYDVSVDIVCTPEATLRVEAPAAKSAGVIDWERLPARRFKASMSLRALKAKLEAEAGAPLPNGTAWVPFPRPLDPFGKRSATSGRRPRTSMRNAGRGGAGNATRAAATQGGARTRPRNRRGPARPRGNRTRGGPRKEGSEIPAPLEVPAAG